MVPDRLPAPPDSAFTICSSSDWSGRSTRAEVNLDAIALNVRSIKSAVSPAELMTVVKADAYGHGSVEIGRAALQNGATRLAVYTVDEGIELRSAGITDPILVFGPFQPSEAGSMVAATLTPTITSVEAAEALQRSAPPAPVPYHIKIDTGLSRAGIGPPEVLPLVRCLAEFPALRLEGVYTHFARADEADKSWTREQLATFLSVVDALHAAGFDGLIRHAANSAATLDVPESHLDMVRVGISTYGYYPSADVSRSVTLWPALSLLTSISRVHSIPPRTGVGYGHEFVSSGERRIALIPVGYGDGLPRSLGGGVGRVVVRGALVPIVGRVSMDQITLDVTAVPGVAVGDEVAIIGALGGQVQTADDVGSQAGTISYDILTGLLPRVPRLYTRGKRIVAIRRQLLRADVVSAES